VRNIRWILDNHLHPYPFRSVLASIITRDGLSLSEASKVTGVPKTTLALQNRKPKTDLLEALTYKVLLAFLKRNRKH
jgi:predicted transcriptional regulator